MARKTDLINLFFYNLVKAMITRKEVQAVFGGSAFEHGPFSLHEGALRVGSNRQLLNWLYHKCNSWLLDYDRKVMDSAHRKL